MEILHSNKAMLITSHILIRLLIQHYYFIDTHCELLTHCHGYITPYRVLNRSFDMRYTLVYLMRTATRSICNLSSEYYYMNSLMLVLIDVWRVVLSQGQCKNLKSPECNSPPSLE